MNNDEQPIYGLNVLNLLTFEVNFYHDFAALEVEIHVSAMESYGLKPLHAYTPEN